MMAEELLSLKWNNHQTHFVDILSILREHETFIDVTIACGGKLYSAHKFVLSTCSDYFKQMFMKNPSNHPIIFMKDVSSRDMEALMDFMYNGEVNVPQSTLGSLIKTAESLQIKGLAVPDDAPIKRDREVIFKEKRRIDTVLSPPAKRLKPKEINFNATKHIPFQAESKSPSRPIEVVNAIVDEDSHSIHSGSSEPSENCKSMNENVNYSEKLSNDCLEDSQAGPSGIQMSKSELEIKLEDVTAEDDDDGSTWNQDCDSRGEEDRGDISVKSDNSNLFVDHLLSGNDGSSLSVSADSAMFEEHPAFIKPQSTKDKIQIPRSDVWLASWGKTPHKQLLLHSELEQLDKEIEILTWESYHRNVKTEIETKMRRKQILNKRLKQLVIWQKQQRAYRESVKQNARKGNL